MHQEYNKTIVIILYYEYVFVFHVAYSLQRKKWYTIAKLTLHYLSNVKERYIIIHINHTQVHQGKSIHHHYAQRVITTFKIVKIQAFSFMLQEIGVLESHIERIRAQFYGKCGFLKFM